MKDFPYKHRLHILEKDSLIGEEDIVSRDGYSSTLKCYSQKGTVYKMGKEYFKMLRNSENSWLDVMKQITYKEYRSEALDIEKKEPVEDLNKLNKPNINKLERKSDPTVFSLVTQTKFNKLAEPTQHNLTEKNLLLVAVGAKRETGRKIIRQQLQ